ncbi:MAG: glycerol-3-phosphate 1-O-acyltransferase PlsY [Blautia sp.]|nr:glycerol-3-phosphate 1-O-acyltransferase PlsY [Blautia sp.]
MVQRLVCLAVGYVCGLFQTSYFIGRMHNIDIRNVGSGNAGSTNILRTFGKKAGFLNLFCDMFKCVLAVQIVKFLYADGPEGIMPLLTLYASAGCILGHNFPFYLGFKGGKGMATSAGMVLAFDWRIFVIIAPEFITLFFVTHYVSLSALITYVTVLVLLIIYGTIGLYPLSGPYLMEMYILFALLTALAFFQHRENLKRLCNGTERKTYLSKSKK